MGGYGQASLTELPWGKPERNLMIGFYKHSAPTEPRRRVRGSVFASFAVRSQEEEPQRPRSEATQRSQRKLACLQLRQERDVCSMSTNRSISERVKHATGICRRQAASGVWDERLRSGKPDRTAMGQARTKSNDRVLQTFGSYGAKTASRQGLSAPAGARCL